MKKLGAILCCILLLLGLAACGDKDKDKKPSGSNTPEASARRLGTGCVASRTMESGDKTRVKATAAAVVLDADGKIEDVSLDEVEFMVGLTEGKSQQTGNLTSKGELGDAYTLTEKDNGGASSLKTSWHDQVYAFCTYIKGKTAAEVSGIAATDGKSSEITGCDLIITDFIKAVRRAADNAEKMSGNGGSKLRLALTAAESHSATQQEPQYDVELSAVTMGADDKIAGCYVDSVQMKLTVENGMFTTVSGEVESKRDMKESYAMKGASSIGKEWYEQAAAFDAYAVGKTAKQLEELKLDGDGKTDGISGCTMGVSEIVKNTVKAARMEH